MTEGDTQFKREQIKGSLVYPILAIIGVEALVVFQLVGADPAGGFLTLIVGAFYFFFSCLYLGLTFVSMEDYSKRLQMNWTFVCLSAITFVLLAAFWASESPS